MEVTLIAAQSLDGFITRHEIPGTAFTSDADKKHFPATLADFDASIMGSKTYAIARDFIRQRLSPARRRLVLTRDPSRWAGDAIEGQLEFTSASAREIISYLRSRGHRRCALLGGAQVHSLFFEANSVDSMIITVEPRLFGAGTPLLHSKGSADLVLESHERLDGTDTLLLRYRVRRRPHAAT